MKVKMNSNILIDYFEGVCSDEQKRAVEAWIEADASHREEFQVLRRIWEAPGRILPRPDVEAALKRVKVRAGIGDASKKVEDSKIYRFESIRSRMSFGRLVWGTPALRAAAMILFVVGIAFVSYFIATPSVEIVEVAYGAKAQVALPDGSKVTLDAGSRLDYPTRFGKTRKVTLDGEGYFQVTPGSSRFVIRAHAGIVTVLGTKFNVRAWEHTKVVEVAVSEGRVSLRREKTPEDEAVTIEEGRLSRLEEGLPSSPEAVDIVKHLSWLIRERHYENRPLYEVLDQMERWYALSFVLPDPSAALNRVTVYIENRPVEEILDMLALVNGFAYDLIGRRVVFTRIE